MKKVNDFELSSGVKGYSRKIGDNIAISLSKPHADDLGLEITDSFDWININIKAAVIGANVTVTKNPTENSYSFNIGAGIIGYGDLTITYDHDKGEISWIGNAYASVGVEVNVGVYGMAAGGGIELKQDEDVNSVSAHIDGIDTGLSYSKNLGNFEQKLTQASQSNQQVQEIISNNIEDELNQESSNDNIPSYDDWFNKKYTEWFEGEFSQWFDINYETYLSEQYDDYLDAQYSEQHSNKNTEWRNEKYAQWYSEQHWELHDEKYDQWQDEKYFDWYYEQYYQLSDENAPSTAERTELLKSSDTNSFYSFDLRQELAA